MILSDSPNFIVFSDTVLASAAPATVKQAALLAKLAAETAGSATAAADVEALASHQTAGTLTVALASAFIDALHAHPKTALPPFGAALAAHFTLAS